MKIIIIIIVLLIRRRSFINKGYKGKSNDSGFIGAGLKKKQVTSEFYRSH